MAFCSADFQSYDVTSLSFKTCAHSPTPSFISDQITRATGGQHSAQQPHSFTHTILTYGVHSRLPRRWGTSFLFGTPHSTNHLLQASQKTHYPYTVKLLHLTPLNPRTLDILPTSKDDTARPKLEPASRTQKPIPTPTRPRSSIK